MRWNDCGRKEIETVEEMTASMVEVVDKVLKKEYERRVNEDGWHSRVEATWMKEEIRNGIKERKKANRRWRRCKGGE